MFKIKVELKMTLTDSNNEKVILIKSTETESPTSKIKIVFENILKIYFWQAKELSKEITRKYINKTKS